MKTETHWLSKGQFLAKLEPFESTGLQTDAIYHKYIPGCGATTLEIIFPRHSIIIEPNVPVISGKCAKYNGKKHKHKKIMGVYEGVEIDDIKWYLENCEGYKKILVTPEGYHKVAEAIGESRIKDYFLLFDECEKAIQDVNFRPGVINPIDDFFLFDNKAFVSATPIIPSDPRFKDFTHSLIKPDYDFKSDIQVFTTNNVTFLLKQILDQYNAHPENKDRKFFIFFKSTSRIKNIIKGLNLSDHSVFCSEKSTKELKRNNVENAYYKIGDSLTKYNFLTSRFFSAVDIDYELYKCDPIIIMISDVVAVQHSTIDPNTEAIQICGRFRAPEDPKITVKKDVIHISNYNSAFTSYSRNEILEILRDKERLHRFIVRFRPKSHLEYFNEFIKEILNLNGFSYFLKEGTLDRNHFMVDNFVNEEKVKGYYKWNRSLKSQYDALEHFSVAPDSRYVSYTLSDLETLEIGENTKTETLNDFVGRKVKEVVNTVSDPIELHFNLMMLRLTYPEQMGIIDSFGFKNAKEVDFNIKAIVAQQHEAEGLKRLLPIIKYIQREFTINQGYTSEEIKDILSRGISETKVAGLKPNLSLLRNGAILSERDNVRKDENGNWLKGYIILDFRQNFDLDKS
ncbi:hypothetical protein [Desertivirga xinjiangensis]|uniref:hypothetical protein n=1 Tax=Desertivirga xinjiangensis TaxID=539206 RepID=UPI00210C6186|nr:hypothetical protein [Pedobacter xinjiangensis]